MSERIRYAALCRQGPHAAIDHHSSLFCECPCHGGDGPWWADIRRAAVAAIAGDNGSNLNQESQTDGE